MTRRASVDAAKPASIRVVMTKTMRGSENGLDVTLFEEGREYDMEASLAQAFMKSKAAKPAPAKTPEGGDPNKGGKGPGENK